MGALPKQRVTRARQGNRRSHHHLDPIPLMVCPQCRRLKRPHFVCPTCGAYNGRTVIDVERRRR